MYQFLAPTTLEEAAVLLCDKPGLRILAGGTDLIIALKDRIVACDTLMDCKKIPELQTIRVTDEGLEVGAAVSLNRMLASGLLDEPYAALRESAAALANSLLRNRATLAGNICNASPGGDMLAPALVLGAWVETMSPIGVRRIALKDFFTGVKKHVLAPDEMLVKTVFPHFDGQSAYRKKKRIKGHDLAQVGVAASYAASGALQMALGAVAPTPVLLDLGVIPPGELHGRAKAIAERAAAAVSPITDVRSSKEYRLAMVRHLAREIIETLAGKEA